MPRVYHTFLVNEGKASMFPEWSVSGMVHRLDRDPLFEFPDEHDTVLSTSED